MGLTTDLSSHDLQPTLLKCSVSLDDGTCFASYSDVPENCRFIYNVEIAGARGLPCCQICISSRILCTSCCWPGICGCTAQIIRASARRGITQRPRSIASPGTSRSKPDAGRDLTRSFSKLVLKYRIKHRFSVRIVPTISHNRVVPCQVASCRLDNGGRQSHCHMKSQGI